MAFESSSVRVWQRFCRLSGCQIRATGGVIPGAHHHVPGREGVVASRPRLYSALLPRCQKEMRIVSLIDDQAMIERILRHLGLWQQGVRVDSGPDPPGDWVIEPCFEETLPDYDTDWDLIYANV